MAIRIKNLDLNTDGMKGHQQVSLGDVTATRAYTVFVAPVACVVNFIDLYGGQAVPPAANTASTTNVSATVHAIINDTASVMVVRGTSATGVTTDSISANARYRLVPSANNSLTVGTPVKITFTVGGSAGMSGVICDVTYTPLTHRGTR